MSNPSEITSINSQLKQRGNVFFVIGFMLVLTFISAFYFIKFGDYIFFVQENMSLFIWTTDYFNEFIYRPGGLLEYGGKFLTQFYFSSIMGVAIITLLLLKTVFIFYKINQKLSDTKKVILPLVFLPAIFMFLLQINYNYYLYHNLGFLVVGFWFYVSVLSQKKVIQWIFLILFPLFYFAVGAYAIVYAGMYVAYCFIYLKGNSRYIFSGSILGITAASFFLFKDVLFYFPGGVGLFYPFSIGENLNQEVFFYGLIAVIGLFPLLIKYFENLKLKGRMAPFYPVVLLAIVFILALFQMSKLHDSKSAHLFQIEKKVVLHDWDGVIKSHQTNPSTNLLGQFYFNLALSEKGEMANNLFSGRQDFGTDALVLPWELNNNIISRGVYFYYAIGLINEAHHWAYESMVSQGYRPENLKMLVKTNLINGHFRMAKKYISILKNTFYYKEWAKKYEKMLFYPELVKADPELSVKQSLLSDTDFFVDSKQPQLNLAGLMNSNKMNKKVFEYGISWLMLRKNVNAIITQSKSLKERGYANIPRHIEEVALMYSLSNQGELPDFGGLEIRSKTKQDFRKYIAVFTQYNGNMGQAAINMQEDFADTYWYFIHFSK